jgi:hypothetical protein
VKFMKRRRRRRRWSCRRRRSAANAVGRPSSSTSLFATAPLPSWRRERVLQGVEPVVPGVGESGEKLLESQVTSEPEAAMALSPSASARRESRAQLADGLDHQPGLVAAGQEPGCLMRAAGQPTTRGGPSRVGQVGEESSAKFQACPLFAPPHKASC